MLGLTRKENIPDSSSSPNSSPSSNEWSEVPVYKAPTIFGLGQKARFLEPAEEFCTLSFSNHLNEKNNNLLLGNSFGAPAEHEGPLQETKAMERSSLTVTWLTPVVQWWDRGQNPNHQCGLCTPTVC